MSHSHSNSSEIEPHMEVDINCDNNKDMSILPHIYINTPQTYPVGNTQNTERCEIKKKKKKKSKRCLVCKKKKKKKKNLQDVWCVIKKLE